MAQFGVNMVVFTRHLQVFSLIWCEYVRFVTIIGLVFINSVHFSPLYVKTMCVSV